MPLDERSLDELGVSSRGYFRQYLPGADAWVRENVVSVIAKVISLFARGYELRLQYIFKQLFARTCTDMAILRMHGADVRIYRKGAAAAEGQVSGTGQPSATYPAGVRYLASGNTYLTTAAFSAAGDGSFVANVKSEGVGTATNLEAGARLTLADPSLYPTLSDTADVGIGGLGGGAEIEGLEEFRARVLSRKGAPPQGGALSDYERFAMEVPGVVKAWAYQASGGVGAIVVFFLFAGRASLIPEPSDVAVVQAYIDSKRLIRVDDDVAAAPTPSAVNITISDLAVDTPEVRAAIAANLDAMFLARCRPGVVAEPFTLYRSWISEAISAATGEDSHTLTLPASDLTFSSAYPVPGTISYA